MSETRGQGNLDDNRTISAQHKNKIGKLVHVCYFNTFATSSKKII